MLIETNPLRNAVARNDDVKSLLKEPMNIEALEEERAALRSEESTPIAQIEQLESAIERFEST